MLAASPPQRSTVVQLAPRLLQCPARLAPRNLPQQIVRRLPEGARRIVHAALDAKALDELRRTVPNRSARGEGGTLAQRGHNVRRRAPPRDLPATDIERGTLAAAVLHRSDDTVERMRVADDRRGVIAA